MTPGNIVLLVVFVLLLVMYPILMSRRNKAAIQKQQELIDSLKPGTYVLTYSGIFGKIVEIVEKEVERYIVIETGEKKKSFVTVSERAIQSITNNNPKVYDENGEVVTAAAKEETQDVEPQPEDKDEK